MTRLIRQSRCLAVAVLMILSCVPASADTVVRRGDAGELRGRATIDDAGVTVRSESGARIFVPWDRVRTVHADQRIPGLDAKLEMAVDLWRARSRLERGDAALAEPLFGLLFARFRGQTHETALVAAEGLLRCCLARGAQAEAVIPALEAIRIRRAGVETVSYAMLPAVIDEQSELCTQLAPFWIADRNLLALDDGLDRYDSKGDRVVVALAALYHKAVREQLGGPPPDGLTSVESSHLGIELLNQVVTAAFAGGNDRDAAHEALESRLDQLPQWGKAWARMAMGAGLLADPDRTMGDRGLVHLAYLPARYAATQPFLAGYALDRIKSAMQSRGDADAVEVIENELRRRFPGHPVLLHQRSVAAARQPS